MLHFLSIIFPINNLLIHRIFTCDEIIQLIAAQENITYLVHAKSEDKKKEISHFMRIISASGDDSHKMWNLI